MFLIISFVFSATLVLFTHVVFRKLMRAGALGMRPLRILIVGANRFALSTGRRLEQGPFNCRIVGYVRLPQQEVDDECPRSFEVGDLERLTGVDEAVIALAPAEFSKMPEALKFVEKLCFPTRAILDLGEGNVAREKLFQFGRLQMLDLVATPAESVTYAVLKRLFDICFSALAILLASPILLIIAIAIKLSSPGPVLFRQQRVGLNGKLFDMYKFRSMRVAPPGESDTLWTTQNDPRRTVVGAFLRSTSLDELPQFFNVLLGDMSVVGPRPERPHFVNQFRQQIDDYDNRHLLKVGITGWAQVNGLRGDTSIQKRIDFDLYYLYNWSFAFDLQIIFMTLTNGLLGKNAY
jgi:Undecaprenyl-phosphate glucose phosphotransferase